MITDFNIMKCEHVCPGDIISWGFNTKKQGFFYVRRQATGVYLGRDNWGTISLHSILSFTNDDRYHKCVLKSILLLDRIRSTIFDQNQS